MKSIAAFLPSFVAPVLVLWLARRALDAPRSVRGTQVVEYGLPQKSIGVAATLLLSYLIIREFVVENGEALLAALILSPCLALAAALAAHWCVSQIRFDDENIEVVSVWRRRRLIPIRSVRQVSSGMAGWTVRTDGFGTIRFNHLQRGWLQFRQALAARRQPP